ncbi:mannose-6-phosphate isomerase, class I [Kwoniella sp. DSM 27419]
MSIFKIAPGVQSYDWGKKGSASLAAQLGSVSVPGFDISEDKTYAELWMGTHPTLPSKLDDSSLLIDHLKSHPELMGDKVTTKFEAQDGALPFLFKVLSIGTALSIQAHPDKKLAKRLFKERSDVYKDPNHKPEMAIALTPFLAFLNFLPLPLLLLNLLVVSELDPIIPQQLTSSLAASLELPTSRPPDASRFKSTAASPTADQRDILKQIFNALMTAEKDTVEAAITSLVKRYQAGTRHEAERPVVDLLLMLQEQYPNDVGVLCVFFLNVVELKRGEAAFLEANSPHAYIKGDIIECMATSDNVVRAGLTPKLRDVPTLVEMLTYDAGPGDKQLLQPSSFADSTQLYDPPIEEFSVLRVELDGSKTTHRAIEGPSIAVVTDGKGTLTGQGVDPIDYTKGDVLFIGAGQQVQWDATGHSEVFRAFVEA